MNFLELIAGLEKVFSAILKIHKDGDVADIKANLKEIEELVEKNPIDLEALNRCIANVTGDVGKVAEVLGDASVELIKDFYKKIHTALKGDIEKFELDIKKLHIDANMDGLRAMLPKFDLGE